MHLFLSPHLDDAVLSCGGLIHQLVQAGERVRVCTIMAGDPPAHLPDTPLIRDLHTRWAAGNNPLVVRREEDRQALTLLGAEIEHLNLPDCPYRVDAAGHALYPTNDDLFGAVHPNDPALALPIDLPATTRLLYAPLGAGGHVDHLVVRELAQRLAFTGTIRYYEEYPYSASGGEAVRIGQSEQRLHGSAAVQHALTAFDFSLSPVVIPLSEADMQAKIAAVRCYQSQISTFWADVDEMNSRIRAYAQSIAEPFAERYWG